jgi:hypothetical protein
MVWQIIAIKKTKSGQHPYFSDHLISGIRIPQVQIPLRYKQSLHWYCQASAPRLSLVPVVGFPRPGNDAVQPLEKSASNSLICNEGNFCACGLRIFDGGCDRLSTEIPNGGYRAELHVDDRPEPIAAARGRLDDERHQTNASQSLAISAGHSSSATTTW